MKQLRIYVTLLVALLICQSNVHAQQDWPQYLGPTRNSVSEQKNILRTWPVNGPEVLWTANVGIGYGGPVIKDGKAYILDRDDKVGDMMRCFDLSSGNELWSFGYDAPGSVMFPGSRSVPAIDGNYVYSCGHFGDLYCIDINTRKPVWNHNVWTDFGGIPGSESEGGFGSTTPGNFPTWAISQCPLVYGDLVIVASQAPEAGVVAYDKLTGNLKWKTPALGPVGYVSPAIVKVSGEDHVVMITASEGGGRGREGSGGKVVGMNPLTGAILWEYNNYQCRIPIPSAFDAGENRILIVGGYEAGSAMIRIEKQAGGSYDVAELYKNIDFGCHTQPPVLVNSYLYAQYSTNERKDGLVCMSMDGKVMWKTGTSPGFDKGSMILVDGLILATDGMTKLYLIEPDPSGFRTVASADMLQAGGLDGDEMSAQADGATQNWAPIALADGKLLIRDQSKLMCVRVAE